jgi:glycosyltransferase involved in cell wall biosynthesis
MTTRPHWQNSTYPIIVFSHLDWDGVWQRPQQFISRFGRTHKVLFVEQTTRSGGDNASRAEFREVAEHPNLTVVKMEIANSKWDSKAQFNEDRRKLLTKYLRSREDLQDPVLWFYDPMAVRAYAGQLNERAIVYDCMDQLSQFRGAPPDLIEDEQHLLEIADVVFTGGPKLYKSKKPHNPNCHCYGCGVDVDHFGKALLEDTPIPVDLVRLKKPVLGFFGVVDERMDYELLEKLAAADPDWNVVIIGPACKVDPASFPKRPNLHFLGRREYKELPSYCKGFDVCLMPFAINEATEYINPTKAQEYMATGTPIVSTPIEDVVLQFNNIVKIGRSHAEFIQHCRRCIENPEPEAVKRGLLRADSMRWDAIVESLRQHIDEVLQEAGSGASRSQENVGKGGSEAVGSRR